MRATVDHHSLIPYRVTTYPTVTVRRSRGLIHQEFPNGGIRLVSRKQGMVQCLTLLEDQIENERKSLIGKACFHQRRNLLRTRNVQTVIEQPLSLRKFNRTSFFYHGRKIDTIPFFVLLRRIAPMVGFNILSMYLNGIPLQTLPMFRSKNE
jgi:hypothetical protein